MRSFMRFLMLVGLIVGTIGTAYVMTNFVFPS